MMGFRKTLEKYSAEPGVDKFMVAEIFSNSDRMMRYYGTPWEREADFPFNFDLIDVGQGISLRRNFLTKFRKF